MRIKRRRLISAAMSVALISGAGLSAVSAQDAGPVLSVDEAVREGLDRNLELQASRAEIAVSEGRLRQSRSSPNPALTVSRATDRGGMDSAWMVEGSIPIEINGRRGARIRIAEAELEVKRSLVLNAELELAWRIRRVYGEAVAAGLRVTALERRLKAAREALELSKALVAEGAAAPLDLSIEGVEVGRILVALEMARTERDNRMLELGLLVGREIPPVIDTGRMPGATAIDAADLEGARRVALLERPDLASLRLGQSVLIAKRRLAETEGRPETELMLGYEKSSSDFGLFGTDENGAPAPIERRMGMFKYGVRITLPVANRNKGEVAAYAAEVDAGAKRLSFAEQVALTDVSSAWRKIAGAERVLEVLRTEVENPSRRNLEVILQTYRLGTRSLVEVLAEQQKLIETELALIDAQASEYGARLDLLKAVGSKALIVK